MYRDEYDKPIIDFIGKGEDELKVAIKNRDLLKSFYGVLKGVDIAPVLKFVLLTGVSKFSKVSIFSEGEIKVYNSFSILKVLERCHLKTTGLRQAHQHF